LEVEKTFEGFYLERKPGRPVNPKRAKAPTWSKNLGGKEGHGFLSGSNPLERRYKAGRFCRKAPERKIRLGTIESIT
jgi:hypothetical protein